MENFSFKMKSTWFDKGLAKQMDSDGFWLYIVLHQFCLKNIEDTVSVSLNMLHSEINYIRKQAGRDIKYSKPIIIDLLRKLKRLKVIYYDNNKYRFKDSNQAIDIKLLDKPKTEKVQKEKNFIDRPITEDDFYLSINTQMVNYITSFGLSEKHVMVYCYLNKFNEQCIPSCETISNVTGLGKNQINRMYLVDLEKKAKVIVNCFSESKTKKRCYNDFKLCKNVIDIDKFYQENEKTFIKNEVKRAKKELQRNKVGTTEKEVCKIQKLLVNAPADLIERYEEAKNKHFVLGIKYFYDEIYHIVKELEAGIHTDNSVKVSNMKETNKVLSFPSAIDRTLKKVDNLKASLNEEERERNYANVLGLSEEELRTMRKDKSNSIDISKIW